MAGFFLTLRHAGWHPGASTGPGSPLQAGYRQTTTVAWLGIVTCQVGTALVTSILPEPDQRPCRPVAARDETWEWRRPG